MGGGRGHPRHKREAERSRLCLPCQGGVGRGPVCSRWGLGSCGRGIAPVLVWGSRRGVQKGVRAQGGSGAPGSPFSCPWPSVPNPATLVVPRSPPQFLEEEPQPQDARGHAAPGAQFGGRFPGGSGSLTLRGALTLPPPLSELLGVPSARPPGPQTSLPRAPPRPAPLALSPAHTIN